MPIIFMHRYNRIHDLQKNPTTLYVFGDNMMRVGYGGQAKEARDEPNAVGIPTLWTPGVFFSDGDLEFNSVKNDQRKAFEDTVKQRIDRAFAYLKLFLKAGGIVVWPSDNVGTGLADLPNKAPTIMEYIDKKFKELNDIHLDKHDKKLVKLIRDHKDSV